MDYKFKLPKTHPKTHHQSLQAIHIDLETSKPKFKRVDTLRLEVIGILDSVKKLSDLGFAQRRGGFISQTISFNLSVFTRKGEVFSHEPTSLPTRLLALGNKFLLNCT